MSTRSVHEPEAELLSADDALQDVARLRSALRRPSPAGRAVPVRVPLWALIEALDVLEPTELQQVVQHAKERLVAIGHG